MYMPRSGLIGRARGVALTAAALMAAATAGCASAAAAFDVKKIEASVFKIYTERKTGMGTGTGFLVNGRRILITNYHVVVDGEKFYVGYREGRDGKLVEARLIDRRAHVDLAVLEAYDDLPGRALTLGEYEPEKLTSVVAVGFPGAADVMKTQSIRTRPELFAAMREPSGFDSTITPGMVSRIYSATNTPLTQTQIINARTVQHNAPINPGNSGGPLIDSNCGTVVGVNSFSPKGAQGVFFSIHSGEVTRFLRELNISYAAVGHACLSALNPGGGLLLPVLIGMAVTLAVIAVVFAWRGGAAVGAVGQYVSRRFTGVRKGAPPARDEYREAQERQRQAGPVNLATTAAAISLHPLGGGRMIMLANGKSVVVGRSRDSEAVIEDDTVSSSHARLELDAQGQRLTVTDLNSSNGTFLNGKRIGTAQAQMGDIIRFGSAEFKFGAGASPSPNGAYSAAPGWMLSGFDTSGRALQFELRPQTEAKTWTIGRDRNRAQLVIDDDSVSGAHAQITYESRQGLTLRDLGSTNGTRVDGAPLGNRIVALSDTGQEITFGAAKLRLSRLIR
jgi:pSer/pThr/pTyr-binding forkhead associated (FHA) protein/S1-C subfamily serine protease